MSYTVTKSQLPEVLIFDRNDIGSNQECVFETFNQRALRKTTGLDVTFVQDNHSKSLKGVLRGLHYQIQHSQGKLVRVIQGTVFDVAVDLRRSSPNFGKWVGVELSANNQRQVWIPSGFAHGFLVTSDSAEFIYKTTDYWHPEYERTLLWNDATVGVQWPNIGEPKLAQKDASGKMLKELDVFE